MARLVNIQHQNITTQHRSQLCKQKISASTVHGCIHVTTVSCTWYALTQKLMGGTVESGHVQIQGIGYPKITLDEAGSKTKQRSNVTTSLLSLANRGYNDHDLQTEDKSNFIEVIMTSYVAM